MKTKLCVSVIFCIAQQWLSISEISCWVLTRQVRKYVHKRDQISPVNSLAHWHGSRSVWCLLSLHIPRNYRSPSNVVSVHTNLLEHVYRRHKPAMSFDWRPCDQHRRSVSNWTTASMCVDPTASAYDQHRTLPCNCTVTAAHAQVWCTLCSIAKCQWQKVMREQFTKFTLCTFRWILTKF